MKFIKFLIKAIIESIKNYFNIKVKTIKFWNKIKNLDYETASEIIKKYDYSIRPVLIDDVSIVRTMDGNANRLNVEIKNNRIIKILYIG